MQKTQSKMKRNALIMFRIIGGLIALLAVGTGIWLFKTNAVVNAEIPNRKVIDPNAYDYYLKATNKLVMRDEISNALIRREHKMPSLKPGMLPPGMKAMDFEKLKKFKSMMPPGASPAPPPDRTYTLADKKAILKANEPALKLFREGLKHECITPLFDPSVSYDSYAELRELARLISLETQVYNQSGEYGKAMQSCLDGLQLGSDTTQGSALMGYLVSVAISTISASNATPTLIDKLTAAELKAATARLENIISKYATFAQILENEKYTSIQSMKSMPSVVASLDTPPSAPVAPKGKGSLAMRGYIRMLLPGYIADWNRTLIYAAKPYPQYISTPAPSCGVFMQTIQPVIFKARFKYEYTHCTNQMLLLQLALRSCKATTGSYPAKLSDLTPRYLKQIPTDRFAPTATYNYKQTPKGYILYSIGPDGRDDKGKTIPRPTAPKENDLGDIVVEYTK